MNAGGCLLAAADHARDQIPVLGMHHMHQISAVINDDVRSYGKDGTDMTVILFIRAVVPRMDFQSVCHKRSRNVVLCGQGVGPRDIHFRAACCKHLTKVRRLRFQMYGKRHLFACKGFGLRKLLFQSPEQIAVILHPCDLHRAAWRQVRISDLTCHDIPPNLL